MATPHSSRATSKQDRTPDSNPNVKLSVIAYFLVGIVYFYRYAISPMLAPRCRFYPTCSQYALEAIRFHGAIRGSWLTLKRICRCNPLSEGGADPVPPKCGCKESACKKGKL